MCHQTSRKLGRLFCTGTKLPKLAASLRSAVVARRLAPHLGLLLLLCLLGVGPARAQSRTVPSHGKIKLDSYNHLLRDVHPASQAQANYLQNRLFASGLKKAERLERHERVDSYDERQLIKQLQSYSSVANRLAAGRPTSGSSMSVFWALVSAFGDHTEVYEALSSSVPPMTHEQFTPTFHFIRILQPSGELEPPPLLLGGAEALDGEDLRLAWSILVKELQSTDRLPAARIVSFHKLVGDYRARGGDAITKTAPASGRLQARKYLTSLGALADALYRPTQCAQIRQYIEQGGFAYYGDNMLGLIGHMLQNRVTPAQGSAAQLALAEVARPIRRVLEQEIAVRFERIDSLAAGEGHRPYAAEYRRHDGPATAMSNVGHAQAMSPINAPF